MGHAFLRRKSRYSTASDPSALHQRYFRPSHQTSFTTEQPRDTKPKKNKQPTVIMPPIFPENQDEDEVPKPLIREPDLEPEPEPVSSQCALGTARSAAKVQFFEDAFTVRGVHNAPEDQVSQDSFVAVEIKTNTKAKEDQFKLIADISFRLAQTYQRPQDSVLVTLEQEVNLLFGNSLGPAYFVKVYALPRFVGPFMNDRSSALIQVALADLLHIPSDRGLIVFTAVPPENMATKTLTLRGEIEQLEQQAQEERPGVLKSISRSVSRRLKTSNNRGSPTPPPASPPGKKGEDRDMEKTAFSDDAVEAQSAEAAKHEEQGTAIKKSLSLRSVRGFMSRRLSELGSLGDVH